MEVEMNDREAEMRNDVFQYVRFQPKRDSPSDARSAMLVVAALIFTLTFEKGTEVPEHIKQGALKDIYVVVVTLGFASSITMLEYLTRGFPFQREIRIAVYAVSCAFGLGVVDPARGQTATIFIYLAFAAPMLLRIIPAMCSSAGPKTELVGV